RGATVCRLPNSRGRPNVETGHERSARRHFAEMARVEPRQDAARRISCVDRRPATPRKVVIVESWIGAAPRAQAGFGAEMLHACARGQLVYVEFVEDRPSRSPRSSGRRCGKRGTPETSRLTRPLQ